MLGYVSFYGRIAPMFFAVITLIVALILHQVMGSTADPRYAIGAARLGGYNGMTMVPMPGGELPFLSGAPLSPSGLLYLVGGLLLAALAFCLALSRSSFGRILQSIRENEQRAELLGFDIRWRKTAIFTIAGAIAGLAGRLFAAWGNFINPEVFSLPQAAPWSSGCWSAAAALYGAVLGAVAVQFYPAISVPRVRPTPRCAARRRAADHRAILQGRAGAGAVAADAACGAQPQAQRQRLTIIWSRGPHDASSSLWRTIHGPMARRRISPDGAAFRIRTTASRRALRRRRPRVEPFLHRSAVRPASCRPADHRLWRRALSWRGARRRRTDRCCPPC